MVRGGAMRRVLFWVALIRTPWSLHRLTTSAGVLNQAASDPGSSWMPMNRPLPRMDWTAGWFLAQARRRLIACWPSCWACWVSESRSIARNTAAPAAMAMALPPSVGVFDAAGLVAVKELGDLGFGAHHADG